MEGACRPAYWKEVAHSLVQVGHYTVRLPTEFHAASEIHKRLILSGMHSSICKEHSQ